MAELRALRGEDAAQVAQLLRAGSGGHRTIDAEEVRSWLTQGLLDAQNDIRVLVENGRIVGYADLFQREDTVYSDVAAPGREDELLAWAEERSREKGGSKLRAQAFEGQDDAVLVARGYERVRSSFEMVIELSDEASAEHDYPNGIEVRAYRPEVDELATYEAQEEAFRDAWDWRPTPLEQWRQFELGARGFDPSLWFLAWDGEEVAGLCLAFPERVGDPGLGWVSILGVRRPWRRRGLGEALLVRAFRALHERGLRRVGLGVDAESPTGATRLYERVGMHVVVRSDSWDKQL